MIVPLHCEYSWEEIEGEGEDDSEEVALAKIHARFAETRYFGIYKSLTAEVNRIDKDMRFSRAGKDEAILGLYKIFVDRCTSKALPELSSHFTALYASVLNVQQPPALRPSDAVGAIADMEYRSVLAGRPYPERISSLTRLAIKQPNSPLVLAALRTSPEVVDMTTEQMHNIRALYVTKARAQEFAAIWQAASGLVFVHSLLHQGLAIMDAMIGRPHSTDSRIQSADLLANELQSILAPFGEATDSNPAVFATAA